MRNCLVLDNRVVKSSADTAGALYVSAGMAYNNTSWANTLFTGATNDLHQTGGAVLNTVAGVQSSAGGTREGNYFGDAPQFKNAVAGDYSLRGDSPARDAGTWTCWGATKAAARQATDFAG